MGGIGKVTDVNDPHGHADHGDGARQLLPKLIQLLLQGRPLWLHGSHLTADLTQLGVQACCHYHTHCLARCNVGALAEGGISKGAGWHLSRGPGPLTPSGWDQGSLPAPWLSLSPCHLALPDRRSYVVSSYDCHCLDSVSSMKAGTWFGATFPVPAWGLAQRQQQLILTAQHSTNPLK